VLTTHLHQSLKSTDHANPGEKDAAHEMSEIPTSRPFAPPQRAGGTDTA